jgi:hypothetical protein
MDPVRNSGDQYQNYSVKFNYQLRGHQYISDLLFQTGWK